MTEKQIKTLSDLMKVVQKDMEERPRKKYDGIKLRGVELNFGIWKKEKKNGETDRDPK